MSSSVVRYRARYRSPQVSLVHRDRAGPTAASFFLRRRSTPPEASGGRRCLTVDRVDPGGSQARQLVGAPDEDVAGVPGGRPCSAHRPEGSATGGSCPDCRRPTGRRPPPRRRRSAPRRGPRAARTRGRARRRSGDHQDRSARWLSTRCAAPPITRSVAAEWPLPAAVGASAPAVRSVVLVNDRWRVRSPRARRSG